MALALCGCSRAAPSSGTAKLPDVSPRSVAALTTYARRTWQADAIPVLAQYDVDNIPGSQVDFYSPSTGKGLMADPGSNGITSIKVDDPHWGTIALPRNFVSLAQAAARAPEAGVLQHAALFYSMDNTNDPASVVWDLSFGANNTKAIRVFAYIMPKAGVDSLDAAARGGNARAAFDLAQAYATGVAGTVDLSRARRLLVQAAKEGDAQAANRLGQFYQFGWGGAADPATAFGWYRQAANAGFAPAEFNLGLLYETGRGVKQDWIKADYWISAAAKKNAPGAYQELSIVRNAALREQHARELATRARAVASCGPGHYYDVTLRQCRLTIGALTFLHDHGPM